MLRVLKNRSLIRVFAIMFFSMTASTASSSALMPFAINLGATAVQLGLISLVSGIFSTLLYLPLGMLSDRVGRKPFILIPEIVACLSDLGRALATEPWHLIALSALGGLHGIESSGLVATIGDVAEPQDRPDALGTLYLASSFGMLAGPSAASLLSLFFPLRSLFLFTAALRIFNLLATPGIKGLKKPERGNYAASVKRLFTRRNMLVSLDMRLAHGFFEAVRRTYVPLLAKQVLGLPDPLIISLSVFESFPRIGVRLFIGKLIRTVKSKILVAFTYSLEAAAALLLPFSGSFFHLAAFAFIAGLVNGVESPISALLVTDASTLADRGVATSTLYLALSSGSLAPLVTIPIVEFYDNIAAAFPVASILPLTAVFAAIKVMEPLSTERKEKASS